MAEGVQRALRQAHVFVGDGEDDARGAERDKALPGRNRADADRRGRIVARPARDGDFAAAKAPGRGDLGREIGGDLGALDQRRHVRERQARGREQVLVPAPAGDVEP